MSAAQELKISTLFEEVPDQLVESIVNDIRSQQVELFASTSEGVLVRFKANDQRSGYLTMEGTYRCHEPLPSRSEMTFSFVHNDNKYLFKGLLFAYEERQAQVHFLTTIYRLQRRASRRIRVPLDFYGVIRVTHLNTAMVRTVGKLFDVSPGGMGIMLPADALDVAVGDLMKVVINVRQRPTENIELKVVRKHFLTENNFSLHSVGPWNPKAREPEKGEIILGTVYYPEDSPQAKHQMNSIVLDIYRYIFGLMFFT